MPNPRRIYDRELYTHFVTFSCYNRRKLLDLEMPRNIVVGNLNAAIHARAAKCVGFVIMTDHVHAALWFPEPGQLSEFIQTWKRRSSEEINRWYRRENIEYFQSLDDDPIWQSKYYSFEIYSESKLEEKLNYMHVNPVRAGLVQRGVEWRWSSARYYLDGRSVGVPIEWVF